MGRFFCLFLFLGFTHAFAQVQVSGKKYPISSATSSIRIDGVLDEEAWSQATKIPLNYEWTPGNNTKPPVQTECLVTYDDRRFYIAFRCFDPNYAQIRAHLMDRDAIFTFVQDDHVGFQLDTFHDKRRAFQFRINPLGVQMDAIFSELDGIEDFSWDAIWNSAGKINDTGYVVEVALPFNQLRFPADTGPQTWGIDIFRSYPRAVRHRMSSAPRDRNNGCILCQVDAIEGLEGISPGKNLEITPTLTASRTDVRDPFPDGDIVNGDEDTELGVTGRWGITPNLTLSGTYNPDFSQVEADVAQLEVNTRFALFFPEKRPFFLEGVDFFATPLQAVFTRTVVDPKAGLKLTGKYGKNGIGVFLTEDEVNTILIPSNQNTHIASLDGDVTGVVLRYRRDIGANSTVGALLTDRGGDAGYENRVYGVDSFLRLSPKNSLQLQALRSETTYPGQVQQIYAQDSGQIEGDALFANFNHFSNNWFAGANYRSYDPGFRADSGFINRVDTRDLNGFINRVFRKASGWYTQIDFGIQAGRIEDHNGELTDQNIDLFANYRGPFQSFVGVNISRGKERFGQVLYDLDAPSIRFQMQPNGWAKLGLNARFGDAIDFDNDRKGDLFEWGGSAELKFGRHLNFQLNHNARQLEIDQGEVFQADLSQLRAFYHFNLRAYFRALVQYRQVDRDPNLFRFSVAEAQEGLFNQLLFSYKVNPSTVFLLGYADNRAGADAVDLTLSDRTFFLKLGYAWTY